VALKLMLAGPWAGSGFVRRFRAETERRVQRLAAYTSDIAAAQAALSRQNRGKAMDLLRR
jgi:hypothetical protein